jgi:adenylate cyclase
MKRGQGEARDTQKSAAGHEETSFVPWPDASSLRTARRALLVAFALYLAFGALDPLLAPNAVPELWSIRAAAAALLLAAVVTSLRTQSRRVAVGVVTAGVLVMGTGFVAMVVASERSGGEDYAVALVVLVLFAHALLPSRRAQVCSWTLTAAYVTALVVLEDVPALAGNTFFLIAADLAGTLVSSARDRSLRSEKRFRELVEYASSIILRWDADGTIRFINPYATRFFGFAADELIGRNVIGTIVPDRESTGRDLQELIHDIAVHPERYVHNENEVRDRGGRRFWVVWTNRALADADGRVREVLSIGTDITELKTARESLARQRDELAELNLFIRRIFGRYVSEAVMSSLLESPDALRVGGTRQRVSILVADIRGFSTLAEGLSPEQVVALLNTYLEAMTDVIERYGGTIDEFMGDGILVIFGAPAPVEDHAERAIACALAMQQAMSSVNARNAGQGLPAIEMGVGVNTGDVVVGNIGSAKRAKYGVVGTPVNLASRIEAYTVGGQVLISDATRAAANAPVGVRGTLVVEPKGASSPIAVHDVIELGGEHGLRLPRSRGPAMVRVHARCTYVALEHKFAGQARLSATVRRLSGTEAELACERPLALLSNVRLRFARPGVRPDRADVYGKVIERLNPAGDLVRVRFTAVSTAARAHIDSLLADSGKGRQRTPPAFSSQNMSAPASSGRQPPTR